MNGICLILLINYSFSLIGNNFDYAYELFEIILYLKSVSNTNEIPDEYFNAIKYKNDLKKYFCNDEYMQELIDKIFFV